MEKKRSKSPAANRETIAKSASKWSDLLSREETAMLSWPTLLSREEILGLEANHECGRVLAQLGLDMHHF